ncbi:MAG: hypothetical protein L6R40_006536 [Gallowayella cf. fulva]|nr:MAG: hypothetical protein L6R40_006536 [Xanthomendoza cf. fulva]
MAKGLRSSVKKANKSRLRSRVFGPVENARKERLSAKLLEKAGEPSLRAKDDTTTLDPSANRPTTAQSNLSRRAKSSEPADEGMETLPGVNTANETAGKIKIVMHIFRNTVTLIAPVPSIKLWT